ncbi:MAG: hypothetical protein FWH54_00815 [Methanobrevibacter sp.]|nr:hypothetical protein [Methanobrevibacter sp.]
MEKKLKIIIALGILAVFIISVSAVDAANLYVSNKGTDSGKGTKVKPFKTIKKAVANAKNGDTIYLNSGTYTGASNRKIIINKNIKITALSKNIKKSNTKINAGGKSRIFDVLKKKKVSFTGITFINGKSTLGGGAILSNGDLTINKCKFDSNKVTKSGGAVHGYKGSVTIKNSVFTSNYAKDHGGAVYTQSAKTSISNSQFKSNSAKYGGGFYQFTNKFTLNKNKFTSNKVTKFGGGVCVSTSSGTISNSLFSSNSASEEGGGVRTFKSTVTISNSQFIKNSGASGGGILYNRGFATITNSNFTSNSAKKCGGGIYSYNCTTTISKANFNKNSASYSEGHAIINYGSIAKLSIKNCNFIDNKCIVKYEANIRNLAESIKKNVSTSLPTAQYVTSLANAVLSWVSVNIKYPSYTDKIEKGIKVGYDFSSFLKQKGWANEDYIRDPSFVVNTKWGVCEGCAKLNVALSSYLNIPIIYVSGLGGNPKSMQTHAWNVVYIDYDKNGVYKLVPGDSTGSPGVPGSPTEFKMNAVQWWTKNSVFIDNAASMTFGAVSNDRGSTTINGNSYIKNTYGYGIVFSKSYA